MKIVTERMIVRWTWLDIFINKNRHAEHGGHARGGVKHRDLALQLARQKSIIRAVERDQLPFCASDTGVQHGGVAAVYRQRLKADPRIGNRPYVVSSSVR